MHRHQKDGTPGTGTLTHALASVGWNPRHRYTHRHSPTGASTAACVRVEAQRAPRVHQKLTWRWLATFSRVMPSTFISCRMVLGTASGRKAQAQSTEGHG